MPVIAQRAYTLLATGAEVIATPRDAVWPGFQPEDCDENVHLVEMNRRRVPVRAMGSDAAPELVFAALDFRTKVAGAAFTATSELAPISR